MVNDLQQVGGFLWVLRFPPPIQPTSTINWNFVESGIKHHNSFYFSIIIYRHHIMYVQLNFKFLFYSFYSNSNYKVTWKTIPSWILLWWWKSYAPTQTWHCTNMGRVFCWYDLTHYSSKYRYNYILQVYVVLNLHCINCTFLYVPEILVVTGLSESWTHPLYLGLTNFTEKITKKALVAMDWWLFGWDSSEFYSKKISAVPVWVTCFDGTLDPIW